MGAELSQRVYAPTDLELGSPTPEEIAAAILAEIIAVRRGGSGQMHSRAAKAAEKGIISPPLTST